MRQMIGAIAFLFALGCGPEEEHYPDCMETTWKITMIGPDTLTITLKMFNYDSGGLFGNEHFDAVYTINGHSYQGQVGYGYMSYPNSTIGAYMDSTSYYMMFSTFDCNTLAGNAVVNRNFIDTTYYIFRGKED